MANIPIVVVAYDRLHSLKRITDSLLQAEYPQGAELIISIDRGRQPAGAGICRQPFLALRRKAGHSTGRRTLGSRGTFCAAAT